MVRGEMKKMTKTSMTIEEVENKNKGKHIRYLIWDVEYHMYREPTAKEFKLVRNISKDSIFKGEKYIICILRRYPNFRLRERTLIER